MSVGSGKKSGAQHRESGGNFECGIYRAHTVFLFQASDLFVLPNLDGSRQEMVAIATQIMQAL